MYDLENKLDKLPDKPGVYLMKNQHDEIIYVGKSISLKNRVRQYFQKNSSKDTKTRALVKNIRDFEYIIVNNEIEALILESTLIKENQPKYNILLRDDKQYPYIKITKDRYPRVLKTREISEDGAKYFGPYTNVGAVNQVLEVIRDIYPIRDCNRNLENGKSDKRPCLNYFIGRCMGPCRGVIKDEEYQKHIDEIYNILDGREFLLLDMLEDKMVEASKNLEFEEAAKYRNQIESLEHLKEKQKVVFNDANMDRDIIGVAKGLEEACIQIFFVRSGKIIGREHFIIQDSFKEERKDIINSFIKQFYMGTAYIPKEILIEEEIEEKQAIEKWLSKIRGNKVSVQIPKIGEKKRLIEMVKQNALDMISKYGDRFLRKQRQNDLALEELKEAMDLNIDLDRIEAFDISNINGMNSVGSMVVFERGESKRSDYRRFRIKTINTPDDYGSMEEVLMRRFKRGLSEREKIKDSKLDAKGFSNFPDLIMMDGGKGQVNIALRVLYELGIDIPVCGLVKDEFHNTRGIIYNNEEINLEENSLGFRMIYKIQEEAHRFAISYHRSLRSKDMFRSELDGIKGIGPKRKRDLLTHFKSLEKIKKSSIDELLQVNSMSRPAAEELYNHFNEVK